MGGGYGGAQACLGADVLLLEGSRLSIGVRAPVGG